ncbi:MAG: ADOP family duplicated permease [Acidobacteriota bacterium]
MSFLRRLWFLVQRNRLEQELREEITFHMNEKARRLEDEEGLDRENASYAAKRAFGNDTLAREASREIWGFAALDRLAQDVRYGFRTLAREPLLVVIAILSLGAAMTAGVAVLGLADAVLFSKLPVVEPDRLVSLRWVAGRQDLFESLNGWSDERGGDRSSSSFALDAFEAARERVRGRADLFAFADVDRVSVVAGKNKPEVATAQVVSGNYYSVLGLRPAAGRFIGLMDDQTGAAPVAVISHAFWMRRFGGSVDAVGEAIRVNGVPTEIVGIGPPGFNGTRQVGDTSDVTLPMAIRDRYVRDPAPDALKSSDPRFWWVIIMARLRDGVTPGEVQPEINAAVRNTLAAFRPDSLKQPFRVEVLPAARGQFEQRAEMLEPIAIMAAIVSVVILIACANIANLLLARGAARDREVAVRLAIGASRGRVIKQLLVESAIIGLAAGLVGVAASRWVGVGLLPALGFEPGTSGIRLAVNTRVLAVGVAGSLICTLIFGLLPAFRCSTVPAARSLRGSVGAGGAFALRGPRLRLAKTILIAQVALSVVVLVAAVLLVRSMRNLEHVDPGFDASNVLLFRVDPSLMGYDADRIRQECAQIVERLRALPGVRMASFSHHGLLYGWSSISSVGLVDGKPPRSSIDANRLFVEKTFFDLFNIPVASGRSFTGLERDGAVIPVAVNRTFAQRAYGTMNAVGRTFKLGTRGESPTYEVQAVVADLRLVSLSRPVPPTVFFSYTSQVLYGATFAVKTFGDPEALSDDVRAAVAAVDPDLPVDRVRSQEAELRHSLREERLFATLALLLGLLALLLACVGIYGLMAYAVARRTREIGVRMALGAERRRVLLTVVWDAARLTMVGLVIGLGAAIAGSRYLESRLFGLTPTDPGSQLATVALLLLTSALAAYLPARRASRVDPMVALRAE